MSELIKELLDLTAFLFITPEIIGRDRLQAYIDAIRSMFSQSLGLGFLGLAAVFSLVGTVLIGVALFSLAISTFLTIKLALSLHFFVHSAWWVIALAVLGVVLSVLVIALIEFIFIIGAGALLIQQVLKKGVSKILFTIGLVAFLAARMVGVGKALIDLH